MGSTYVGGGPSDPGGCECTGNLRIGGSGDLSGAGVVSICEGDTVGIGVSHGGGLGSGDADV